MAFYQPLDISYWIMVFSGSKEIFALVSILAIIWTCSLFRMQMSSFLILLVIYAAILFSGGIPAFLILLIISLSFAGFYIYRRVTQ